MTDKLLAVQAGTVLWCYGCGETRPHRHADGINIECDRGHTQHVWTAGILLSTDQDERPHRLLPPVHCWPVSAVVEMVDRIALYHSAEGRAEENQG